MRPASVPSRRFTTRVPAGGNVWVYWKCQGRDDVSIVRNISMGGIFIETPLLAPSGAVTRLDFLVAEGQIRADAVVRHIQAGAGLGLKFTSLKEPDRPRLAALMTRLRRLHHSMRSA